MAKALLQRETEKVLAARKNSQEKAAVMGSTPPVSIPASAPIPIPKPKCASTSSPAQTPASSPVIQQVFIHTDNTALTQERAARERAEQQHKVELERIKQIEKERVEAEQQARIRAEELQREEAEQYKQLARDDDSLKRKYHVALEKSKADEETIQRITTENELLRHELEQIRRVIRVIAEEKQPEEATSPKEEADNVVPLVPPPYDDTDKPEPVELATHNNEVPLTGEVAPENPVEDSSCAIS